MATAIGSVGEWLQLGGEVSHFEAWRHQTTLTKTMKFERHTTAQLLRRNLTYYWRTNLAVILGVATAVAVLAGALLVGESVRSSLRNLFLERLGRTDQVIAASGFFREQLAADLQNHQHFATSGFASTVPLIVLEGTITHEASGSLGSRIRVYGVDERFWSFHGRPNHPLASREITLSDGLAQELGSHAGDALLLRVKKYSEIPAESLHSKKEDLGRTLRLTMRDSLSAGELGEFAVQPQQGATRAAFVPLKLLQEELEQEGKANLILIAERPEDSTQTSRTTQLNRILKESAALNDYGIKIRVLETQKALSMVSAAGMIPETIVDAASKATTSAGTQGFTESYSYLVNSIRTDGGRDVPYSVVTGVNFEMLEIMQHWGYGHAQGCDATIPPQHLPQSPTTHLPPIIFNQWAGDDLGVKVGERVTLEYYVWLDEGRLVTRSTEFRVGCVIPMAGLASDPDLVPDYPGITESENISDWDPPFPIDLNRIRPQDEEYWKKYRTAPKALIPITVGQNIWPSRFGSLTSVRLYPGRDQTLAGAHVAFEKSLLGTLDPAQAGLSIQPVRAEGLEASRGATDFGEYFLYFSFFLVVSALLLTALFFKLGIEQRLREIGILQAVGFQAARVRKLFLLEGIGLAIIGSIIGLVGALAYAELMMIGLRSWWVEAVGTTMLRLHVSPLSLILGAVGGIAAAVGCIVWTLVRLGKHSTRSLLTGVITDTASPRPRVPPSPRLIIGLVLLFIGVLLLLAAAFHWIGQTVGFFGGGVILLAAFLCLQSAWLRTPQKKFISGTGWWPVARLGLRNATHRPGRSVLCIALIASAAFIIVSVDAFRRREGASQLERKSGSGGFPLLAESLLPVVHDPNAREGREALNLSSEETSSLASVTFTRFRVRPGDDASCLNLYQPRNPKIAGATDEFIRSNRFAFQNSLAVSNEEKENPWLLLNREFPDGVIPIIADANSLTYVLHLKLGDDFVLNHQTGPVRLRVVAALADSIFQSELLMGEKNFVRLFPDEEGYRLFLIDTKSPEQSSAIAATLEEHLSDFGFDVVPTSERLANFHRVENTYLSTFQMLGGLGLLLGTLGLAAVLLRNVLERRRELALLRAVGYNSSHFTVMVIAENALLLLSGLLMGTVCALLAIAPVLFERGGQLPNISLGVLLLAVLISGLIASFLATWAALRAPLLPALRAE